MSVKILKRGLAALVVVVALSAPQSGALAEFEQESTQLVGSGGVGPGLAEAVAISLDGTTAVVGNRSDNNNTGAVWFWHRGSDGTWSLQGSKVVPNNLTGSFNGFGSSVTISSDGNLAVIGAQDDNGGAGGVWVYERSNGTNWDQGQKLTPSDGDSAASFGSAVSISADGSRVVIGGYGDNGYQGAAWIFVNNAGTWSQKDTKLVGAGGVGLGAQGRSVAMSGDGNTIAVGGYGDNSSNGAIWIWVRDSGTGSWSQQGGRLVPDVSDDWILGYQNGVGISYDGNTVVGGGSGGPSDRGGVWIWSRTGTAWAQQGPMLLPSDLTDPNASNVAFGRSVAISGAGDAIVVAAPGEDAGAGANWVFTRSDGTWTQQGSKLVASDSPGSQGSGSAMSGDGNIFLAAGSSGGNSAFWPFVQNPTVASIAPDNGSTAGGTTVIITGAGFSGAEQIEHGVTIGGTDATSVTYIDSTRLSVVTPARGSGGAVDVVVTTAVGSGTGTGAFLYIDPPAVSSVSPSSGPLGGGTSVTITGVHLSGATAVNFGGSPGAITANTATSIRVTSPNHAAGAVDVTVTTVGGTSATGAADKFTYAAVPTVTTISPAVGPIAGGTAITITGTNLTGATAVNLGGIAATGLQVVSATTLTANTPQHAAGAVAVSVTTSGGTATQTGAYTYYNTPAITAINPNQGPATGGTAVTIVGNDLTGATGVTFGGTAATSFSVQDSTHATATAPAHASGSVYVSITTAGGTSATASGNMFTYMPTPVMTPIAKFSGGKSDGGKPVGGLVADSAGALYGTTSQGGKDNLGTVFKLTPSGSKFTKKILHHFTATTGATPFAGLVIDSSKNLYGVTTAGGNKNKGVIFKLSGTNYKVLYEFQGSKTDGGVPYATLARDSKGVLYGATTEGGSKGKGTTFTLTGTKYKVTHHFTGGSDGDNPQGAVLLDSSKNMYGTTLEGGKPKKGTVYKISPKGTRTILHTFASANTDGHQPRGGMFRSGATLFGTASKGGASNKGVVFEIMPPSTAAPLLFSFTGTNGANPYAGVVGDSSATLYGTTFNGGAKNFGTVFKLVPPANNQTAWTQSVMYSFKGGTHEGASPSAPVLLGKKRTLYGTTNGGGSSACAGGCGTVFKIVY